MLAKLFALIPLLKAIADFGNKIADLFRSKREREAGKYEAIIEQKQVTDAETQKAVDARRAQRDLNADPDGLRQPDRNSRT